MTQLDCDICIIGGGSAGLSVAAGAAQMGARTVLVERGAMGGDCLNSGCVPSKSLIAAAHAAHAPVLAARFGVTVPPPQVDYSAVHDHIHGVIAAIAPHDSVERFTKLGVTAIRDHGRFAGPGEIEAGTRRIRARRFVIATGSRAVIPPVFGLADMGPLTNETVFDLTELPRHLMIIGGGPIGIELAQAFRRLGSAVTVLERFSIMPRDEPEASSLIRACLAAEGVSLLEQTEILAARRNDKVVEVHLTDGRVLTGSHLLVAAGRQAVTDGLDLDKAGIKVGPKGIEVDARLRTSNRKVFAIGDVAGGPQFTHIAGYHAGLVIRNALFGIPAKTDYAALPWVTYTDPEVAHVGLTEVEARARLGDVQVLTEAFSGNDRALAERRTQGFAKIILGRRGKIVGATIAGAHAGELIGMWGLAISRRLPLSAIAGHIAPYPTLSEISKRAAGSYFTPKLFSTRTRKIVGFIQKWLP